MRFSKKNIVNSLQRHNIKAFLFFLGMSIIVWLLVQFAKDYEDEVEVSVLIENVPLDKFVKTTKKTSVVKIKASGYEILAKKIFNPRITVDVMELDSVAENYLFIFSQHKEILSKKLNVKWSDVTLSTDTLAFEFTQKAIKEVPIIAKTSINYAAGFSNVDSLKLTPSMVKLSGPKPFLDSITRVYTTVLKFQNVNETLNGTVDIDTTNSNGVKFYETKVQYQLNVDKFTEGEIRVPVELINVPKDIEISIFPKEVTILFQSRLSGFNDISSTDFKVVQDFKDIKNTSDFFVPSITKKPLTASQTRLLDSRIQYIIKE